LRSRIQVECPVAQRHQKGMGAGQQLEAVFVGASMSSRAVRVGVDFQALDLVEFQTQAAQLSGRADFDYTGSRIEIDQLAFNRLLAPTVCAANQTGLSNCQHFILKQVG